MHMWREMVWASPLVRRRAGKRLLSHVYKAVLLGLCLPSGQLSGFFFHTWPTLEPSPRVCTHCSAKMNLKVKAPRRSKTHYGLQLSLYFRLQGNFLGMCTVQFSSVAWSCPTLCYPMDCSTPGLPVHHQLPELTQTHVHWVSDAIQPSHPLSSPSPRAFNLSQHQGLFKWVSSLQQVANVLVFSNLMVIGLEVNYGGSSYFKFTMLLEFVCMSVRKLGKLSCIISLNVFLHYPSSSLRT